MDTKTFYSLSYGMYLVGVADGQKFNAQVVNTAFQITSDPACIAVSLNKKNLTHAMVTSSKKFSVSVLDQATPMEMIGKFGFKSGRDINKFENTKYKIGATGAPVILDNVLAYFEAELISQQDVFTHTIFIGRAVEAEILTQAIPITYAYYHTVKGGRSSQNAPTFQKEQVAAGNQPTSSSGQANSAKFVCKICGYIYDPALGDPGNKILPGTPFDKIPSSWVCPVCGADKSQFEALA